MKNIFLLVIISICNSVNAQNIICPPEQVVHLFDLDESYNSYGTPISSGPESYTTDLSVTTVNNTCDDTYSMVISLNYSLVENNFNTVVAECQQLIKVVEPELTDYTFPADTFFETINQDELIPNVTGKIQPDNFNNKATSYSDVVLNTGNGIKIIRTWIIVDWCTLDKISHEQVITVSELMTNGSGPIIANIIDNKTIELDNVIIRTDALNYTIQYGSCGISTEELTDFLNCVVALNDIPESNNFIIEIENDENQYLNGVSTLDLVLSLRHILGQVPFDNECKEIAADVNNDGNITAFDMLEVRKLILGRIKKFPNSPSWKFMISEVDLSGNGLGVFLLGDDTDIQISKQDFPISDLILKAIKIGDVNNSSLN